MIKNAFYLLAITCTLWVSGHSTAQAQCTATMGLIFQNCPSIQFLDNSTSNGTILTWSWNFGDGGTSTMQNPTHLYTANGMYTVTLAITDNNGCTSTDQRTLNITCISGPVCNAAFQFTLGQCPTVSFFDGSTASPGMVSSWSWDFGDGGTSSMQNPSHTYTANGTYLVCLNILTNDSCTSSFCDSVTITCVQTPTCGAGFQYTFSPNGCPAVDFTDFSTANPGSVASWAWDFGDGGTSATQNPSHSYTANGTYLVCLDIVSTDSCTSTFCDSVVITCIQPPTCGAAFQWTFTPNGCPAVQFSDFSTASPGTIIGWTWDFGDGGTSTSQNPTHAYTADGAYLACLDILTDDSCTSTFCDTVSISCLTGLAAARTGPMLLLYPNPARELLMAEFELEVGEVVTFAIYDLRGRRIRAFAPVELPAGTGQVQLDVSALPAGTYMLVMESETQRARQKLMLRR